MIGELATWLGAVVQEDIVLSEIRTILPTSERNGKLEGKPYDTCTPVLRVTWTWGEGGSSDK